MNYYIPQFIWLLFNAKMVHINYKHYQVKPSFKNRRNLVNILIGIVVMNLNLAWGGFYSK